MSNIPSTRRQVIAALAALPMVSSATVAVAADSPDAKILNAFNRRQHALAMIESRGNFFRCEEHSPVETHTFDLAENVVARSHAKTAEGMKAKLWVALSAGGGAITHEAQRVQSDIIRRANYAEVETFARDLDYDLQTIWSCIVSLTEQGAAA